MLLYGISMVRNEADIIRTNVLYHLSAGLDRIFIFDDGSTDGTDRILKKLARDPRVRWTSGGSNPDFRQGEVFTELAREAHQEGADWVVPIDADDFWYTRGGSLKGVLARSSAAVLEVRHIDFIQRREQRESSAEALLHMTYRVEEPVERVRARELLEDRKISYIGMARVPKLINRTSATVAMVRGAHRVEGIDGPRERTDEVLCMHAPLRSRAVLEAKALSGRRRGGKKPGKHLGPGWLYSRWLELQEDARLEEEWAANSYNDGCLDVYGERLALIFDPTLRDAVAPFVRPPLRDRLLGRLLSR